VNDLPGAGQSRAPARPQAGESATLHHKENIPVKGMFSLWQKGSGEPRMGRPFEAAFLDLLVWK